MDDEDGYFGERVAARYDESCLDRFEPSAVDAVVEVLAGLAGGGRALELGIGTGRIALPLARRGVAVHGIDLSRAMVARLRVKPGGEAIAVTIGDFATARADGTFTVAYLVFNTIMNLTTQAAQVDCFRNVAAQLEPGGCFVIEVMIPDLRRLPAGQNVMPIYVSPKRWAFDVYDTATQTMSSNYVEVTDGWRVPLDSLPVRMAGRTRPDGPALRVATARAMGRVDTGPLHKREPPACLDLGEAHQLTAGITRRTRNPQRNPNGDGCRRSPAGRNPL